MNETQRKILISVGTIILGMLLFPPYRIYGYGNSQHTVIRSGYSFLLDLPHRATVDVSTLLVQWFGVLIVGAIAYYLKKHK